MKEETLIEKIIIGIMFIGIIFLMCWVPDFILDEEDCMKQDSSVYVKNLCSESKAK
jgi:hypothetical protein